MATESLPGLQALLAEIGLEPIPSFAAASVLVDPVDVYRSYLAEHLSPLLECDRELIYESIQPANTTGNGDLDVVLPKLKISGIKPKDLAVEVLKKYQPHPLFSLPFKDGIHLRFFFSPKTIPRLLFPYINDRKASYGFDVSQGLRVDGASERKKILVEFSSPNIAMNFTTAHLRSTVLGAFIANLYEAMGWEVVRVNYLGDWGEHLGLLVVGWKKWGSETSLAEQMDQFKYIHDMYVRMDEELRPERDAKRKARDEGQDTAVFETQGLLAERKAMFKQIEDGMPEAMKLWKSLHDVSVDYYIKTYAQLNVKFDEYSGESRVSLKPEAFKKVESCLKENGVYKEQDGDWTIAFDDYGAKLGTVTVRHRNGSTTYLLRDIATVFDRHETHNFDKMIYVACEHDVHFRQVLKAVELTGHTELAAKLQPITFPKAPGQQPGNGTLGDILDHCEIHTKEAMSAIPDEYPYQDRDAAARTFGINSLIIQELTPKKPQSNGSGANLPTSLEGESGASLQVSYLRLCAAVSSIGSQSIPPDFPDVDYSLLYDETWCDLLRLTARYPAVISSISKSLDPGPLISYVFSVVEQLSYCLDEADDEVANGERSSVATKYSARAVLYESVRQVLRNAMAMLGLIPIDV